MLVLSGICNAATVVYATAFSNEVYYSCLGGAVYALKKWNGISQSTLQSVNMMSWTVFHNTLYFLGDNQTVFTLWKTDGSSSGWLLFTTKSEMKHEGTQ